jgi:hypothetical protein
MPYKFPAYPDILTDKNWQKNKGLFAKGTGETGVGAAMDVAQRLHAGISNDRKKLNVAESMPQGSDLTRTKIDEVLQDVLDYYKANVENKLRPALQDIEKKANAAAATWDKAKTVPKSSAKHARAVAKAANDFMVALNKNSVIPLLQADYQGFVKAYETNQKIIGENTKRLKGYLVKVEKGCKSITTKAEFNGSFWDEDIRGVGTALPALSKDLGIIPEHKIWRTFASEGFKAASDDEVPKKLKQIETVRKRIADAAANLD